MESERRFLFHMCGGTEFFFLNSAILHIGPRSCHRFYDLDPFYHRYTSQQCCRHLFFKRFRYSLIFAAEIPLYNISLISPI